MLTMATQDPLQAHQSHTNHYMKTETPDPSYDYRLGLSAGMDHGHYPPPHHAQYMHGHAFSQVEHMAMANRLPHYSLEALHHDSQHLQHSHHHHGPPLPSHHAHHHSLDGSHNGGGAGGPFSHSHEANLYHHMGVVPSQSSYMDHNLSHVHAGHHSSAQSEMDLEKTYGKPSSNENNHYPSLMPASHSGGIYKNEPAEDPYSFVDEDPMLGQGSHDPNSGDNKNRGMPLALPEPGMANALNPAPKKRGRKKKVEPEIPEGAEPSPESSTGQPGGKRKYTKSEHYKQRRRHDRFNGMSEEEVKSRTLPDHLIPNLDIVIIGINPGLFAAYKGHHYAGPGNHFWKCLYLAGLVPEPMTADDDFKMVHYGIGFTNMVNRATKGSADLTRKEIREGGRLLQEKLQQFRPKIAVFNGKGIYEVYSGKKDFTFGRQPEFIDGTNTYIWVMPSSSARCAQLPRAMDKVPFYAALKKFRDYLNGLVPEIDDAEVVFNDPRIRNADDGSRLDNLKDDQQQSPEQFPPALQPGAVGGVGVGVGGVGTGAVGAVNGLPALPALPGANLNVDPNLPPKKKRGRPKKIRPEDGGPLPDAPPGASAAATVPVPRASSASLAPPVLGPDGTPLKKKRGRPKKIRLDEANKVEPSYVDRGTEQSSSCDGNNGGQLTPTASLTPTSSYPPPLASSSSYASPAFLAQSSVRQSPTRPHSLPHTYHPSPLAMYNQSPSPAHNSSSGSNPASASASQSYDLGCGNEPGRSSSVTGTRSDHTLTPPTQPSPLDPPDFELPSSLPPNDLVAPTSHHSAHHSPHDSDASLHEQPPKLSLATGSYYSNTPNPQQSQPTSATSQQSQPQTPQSQQQQQQQSSAPPPQSARNAYNNGLGAKPNHAGGANQDIATKSLSGLESLVDQIPNLGEHDGPPSLAPQTNFSPNRGPPTHYQTAAFGSYGQSYASAPTSAPPSSTYSSYANAAASGYASYGSPYEHESSFSVPNFGSSFPMAPASGMFGSGTMGPGAASLGMPGLGMPPSTLGYPYSQYPGSPAYTSWNTPGAGLHVPPANYGYPAAYGQPPYPQPGYLNNSVLDRFKHERMDMGFGGY